MEFLDYAREWVIKNVAKHEGIQEEILELATIVNNYRLSIDKVIRIVSCLSYMLHSYRDNPEFYDMSYLNKK